MGSDRSSGYSMKIENLKECSNLYVKTTDVSPALRYYCNLTKRFCVADEYGFIQKFLEEANINKNILVRCPSRKEISDLVKPKGDLQ